MQKLKTEPHDVAFPSFHTGVSLTKREYFAAMILPGLISSDYFVKYISDAVEEDGEPTLRDIQFGLCATAVHLSDELVEALNSEILAPEK